MCCRIYRIPYRCYFKSGLFFRKGGIAMLNVFFGSMPDEIYNTSVYFDNSYMDSWFDDEFTKKIIKSIDRADVLSSKAINSKALGVIPITKLSGGTKTLVLLRNKPEQIYNASTCGDNCAKWILKIAKESKKDITINLHHIMDFGEGNFEIKILNNDKIVRSTKEMLFYAGIFLQEDSNL